ncbi:uncharacterized protein LOC106074747 isoform X2 [Biomphalaria glabrata]|uniref:Uncharacterized protein LOC106074747 isoform X2 n=1 Tax=Biomphalaria glabrata TaxID=6526 RepID=A0A9W2ZZ15_BIOGL|nr:uncharacterized protein LOC106074747 isoform X2 [Biomphalaria glabrata]
MSDALGDSTASNVPLAAYTARDATEAITSRPVSSLSIFLHVVTLLEVFLGVVLCLILLIKTLIRPLSITKSPRTLSDRPVIYSLCCGGILMSCHVLPLGLFHLGFCLFYMSLLLELHRLTERVFKVQQKSHLMCQFLAVIGLPSLLMVSYFVVWYFFYSHDPRHCLVSRHHDYIIILEKVAILAALYLMVPVHKVYPTKDTIWTLIALLISFLGGVTFYVIRLSTESMVSSAVNAILAETHVYIYIATIVVVNLFLKIEVSSANEIAEDLHAESRSRSFIKLSGLTRRLSRLSRHMSIAPSTSHRSQSGLALRPTEDDLQNQTMFQRSLRRQTTSVPTPNADAPTVVWY